MTFAPQMLGTSMLVSGQELDSSADAERLVREQIAARLSRPLADALAESPGGMILSPITYTINTDDDLDMTRIAGTVNYTRLPDPVTREFRLYGGRMHNRIIRVGDPAPEMYLIPWVPPVVIGLMGLDGPRGLTLEYRRSPGSTSYQFVREYGS